MMSSQLGGKGNYGEHGECVVGLEECKSISSLDFCGVPG